MRIGFRVKGVELLERLRFWVQGLGLGVQGLWIGVQGIGCGVKSFGFSGWDLGFRVLIEKHTLANL